MNILIINACTRGKEVSRTHKLMARFLKKWTETNEGEITEIVLAKENLKLLGLNELELRDKLIKTQSFSNDFLKYARQFSKADRIIIAAPYWDLSFPAILKVYFENICVQGVTFHYVSEGLKSLCKAKKMMYITTSGGYIGENDFGTQYIEGLCKMFEVEEFESFKVEGLDIVDLNTEEILQEAIEEIEEIAKKW